MPSPINGVPLCWCFLLPNSGLHCLIFLRRPTTNSSCVLSPIFSLHALFHTDSCQHYSIGLLSAFPPLILLSSFAFFPQLYPSISNSFSQKNPARKKLCLRVSPFPIVSLSHLRPASLLQGKHSILLAYKLLHNDYHDDYYYLFNCSTNHNQQLMMIIVFRVVVAKAAVVQVAVAVLVLSQYSFCGKKYYPFYFYSGCTQPVKTKWKKHTEKSRCYSCLS